MEWTRYSIEWFLDGIKFHHHRTEGCFPGEAAPGRPFDIPFVPILNLAVGGNSVPASDPATFDPDYVSSWARRSANLTVDYVRVYRSSYTPHPTVRVATTRKRGLRPQPDQPWEQPQELKTAQQPGDARQPPLPQRPPLQLAAAHGGDSSMAPPRPLDAPPLGATATVLAYLLSVGFALWAGNTAA